MTPRRIYRGDIYLANLNPVRGSEQGGCRPVIILQNNIGNRFSPTVIVAAVTSRYRKKEKLPTHVPIESNVLDKESQVLLEQIRTIDKSRLISKIGTVSEENMKDIGQAINISLALEGEENEQHNTAPSD